ncbi:hypothetical protein HBB16_11850 [Pseudonocardia sp. MCCB 268]|nr:hypothetical protein [Pseudonocardia cytotoxica]
MHVDVQARGPSSPRIPGPATPAALSRPRCRRGTASCGPPRAGETPEPINQWPDRPVGRGRSRTESWQGALISLQVIGTIAFRPDAELLGVLLPVAGW